MRVPTYVVEPIGHLDGKAIHNIVLLIENGSRSVLLLVRHPEQTTVVPKHFRPIPQQLGKHPGEKVLGFPNYVFRPVEKRVFLSRVSVKVEKCENPFVLIMSGQ